MVQVSTMLVAAVGCLLSYSSIPLVSGSPLIATNPELQARGYTTGNQIHWKGTLEAGKPEVELVGYSFEEIEAQAKALNPDYTIFAPQNASATDESSVLQTRQTRDIHCGWPPGWGVAPDTGAVQNGIAYLQSIQGDCHLGPGPGTCSRVSCSWDSAIFYCNDNPTDHWEPCRWIGDVAGAILVNCWNVPGYVLGQAFDYRNWNTIVAYSNC